MTEAILALLLTLPNTGLDESPDYAQRLAAGITEASAGNVTLAASLVALGQSESRLLERIQAGYCRPPSPGRAGECDAKRMRDGSVEFQARGVFQSQRSVAASDAEWAAMVGTDAENITTAARVAARALRRAWRACGTLEGAFAHYARGTGCEWEGAPKRAVWPRSTRAESGR